MARNPPTLEHNHDIRGSGTAHARYRDWLQMVVESANPSIRHIRLATCADDLSFMESGICYYVDGRSSPREFGSATTMACRTAGCNNTDALLRRTLVAPYAMVGRLGASGGFIHDSDINNTILATISCDGKSNIHAG